MTSTDWIIIAAFEELKEAFNQNLNQSSLWFQKSSNRSDLKYLFYQLIEDTSIFAVVRYLISKINTEARFFSGLNLVVRRIRITSPNDNTIFIIHTGTYSDLFYGICEVIENFDY